MIASTLRVRVLGSSRVSAVVAILATLSLVAYLLFSRAVALWKEQAAYLWFVLVSIARSPRLPTLPFSIPVAMPTVIANVVSVLAVVATGVLVGRTFPRQPFAAPLGIVIALTTAVVPVVTLAAIMWPDGQGHLTAPVIAAAHVLVTAVVARWCSGQSRREETTRTDREDLSDASPEDDAPLRRLAIGLLIIAVPFAVAVLFAGLSGIQGYDSFSDHIARPARWLMQGRLETGIDGEVVTFYPGNAELLVRLTLAFGTDRFAFLIGYASSVVAVWVVYRLAREVGQPAGAASMSALAAASLQVLAYQSMVVYADTFTALCLLLATWLLVIWVRTGATDRRVTVGIGLALGLALGAKYAAGPPVCVLGLTWIWHASRDVRRVGFEQPLVELRWLLPQLTLLGAAVLPGMAFWYLRNLLINGNPLYPIALAGLPGVPLRTLVAGAPMPYGWWQQVTYPWTETGHVLGFETGLGASVASLVTLAFVLAPLRSKPFPGERTLWFVLLFSFLAWAQTGVLVPRYGLFPLLLSFVPVGQMLTAYPSLLLRAVAGGAIAMTMIGVGFQMAGGAAYNLLFENTAPPVPSAISTLPAARILNLAGQPSGYYAMGPDYRHRVVTPFAETKSKDVKRYRTTYLLITKVAEAEFVNSLSLELVGRFERANGSPTSLWRVR